MDGKRRQRPADADIENAVDEWFYCAFVGFRRTKAPAVVFVDMGDGKPWIPVRDWKVSKSEMSARNLVAFARFILRRFAREYVNNEEGRF